MLIFLLSLIVPLKQKLTFSMRALTLPSVAAITSSKTLMRALSSKSACSMLQPFKCSLLNCKRRSACFMANTSLSMPSCNKILVSILAAENTCTRYSLCASKKISLSLLEGAFALASIGTPALACVDAPNCTGAPMSVAVLVLVLVGLFMLVPTGAPASPCFKLAKIFVASRSSTFFKGARNTLAAKPLRFESANITCSLKLK